MPDLIKLEPGKTKLYVGCEDDEIDGAPQEFTWLWIKQATGLRVKDRFKKHIEDGHFGNCRDAGGGKYYLAEGHRDICRFNNKRFGARKDIIISMDDYEDIICGREPKGGAVMVRGVEYTGNASLKKFDSEEFISTPRYTSGQCKMMAKERVERDIREKIVRWHNLAPNSFEYKQKWEARYITIHEPLRHERILVAKRTASSRQIEDSDDLPLGILALISRKLDERKAEYFISRMAEYIESNPILMSNPALAYNIAQVIQEELIIEHLRDLQRLHGDNINKGVEAALSVALARHQKLLPLDKIGEGALPKAAPSRSSQSSNENGGGLI